MRKTICHRYIHILLIVFCASLAWPCPATAAEPSQPEYKGSRELLRLWQPVLRSNGDVPGGLLDELRVEVEGFAELNEGSDVAVEAKKTLPQFDGRDRTYEQTVQLLNEVHRLPIESCIRSFRTLQITQGQPLPAQLADAPWGPPSDNGLRVALDLLPASRWYRLGTVIRVRILVHNSGEHPIVFTIPSWQQPICKAVDSNGNRINVENARLSALSQRMICRLAPGEYVHTPASGIVVGKRENQGTDWANARPGMWIKATSGQKVRVIPGAVQVSFLRGNVPVLGGNPVDIDFENDKQFLKWLANTRVKRVIPLPETAPQLATQTQSLMEDLIGRPVSQADVRQVLDDGSDDDLATKLANWLDAQRLSFFSGKLQPGEISFRVLPADPAADQKPRVVVGPGAYNIAKRIRLNVQQSFDGEKWINQATLWFYPENRTEEQVQSASVALPDGIMSYAIVWEVESTSLWVVRRGGSVRHEFSNVSDVESIDFEAGTGLPSHLDDAIDETLKLLGRKLSY